MPDFYLADLRDELSQGDILDLCPVGSFGSLRVARPIPGQSEPEVKSIVYSHPLPATARRPPTPPLFKRRDNAPEDALFETWLKRCLVVSNDCVAIAKAQNQADTLTLTPKQRAMPWHVVPLEPWPSAGEVVTLGSGETVSMGELIEAGRVHRYLPVPEKRDAAGGEVVPRCYADFRFLTPLKPELFQRAKRVASLSDYGVALIWAKILTYFSGRPMTSPVRCPRCNAEFPLADLLAATPPGEA